MRKIFQVLTVVFFVITLVLVILTGISDKKRHSRVLYGVVLEESEKLYEHHSLFPFSSPFIDLSITKIAEENREYFLSPPQIFFENYPDFGMDDRKWNSKKWTMTPATPDEFEKLSPLLDTTLYLKGVDEANSKEISHSIRLIRRCLQENNGYYAYHFIAGKKRELHIFLVLPDKELLIKYSFKD